METNFFFKFTTRTTFLLLLFFFVIMFMGISVMCVVSIGEERVRDAADRIRAESGGQRTDRTHQQGGADT